MGRARFYHKQLSSGRVTLSREESHHARTVLRTRPGDMVALFDGEGGSGDGVVADVGRDAVVVDVADVTHQPFEAAIRLTLAVASPRKNRQSFLVEKCTELGVWGLIPLDCDRSVVKAGADLAGRWRRTAVEAAKQSRRTWLPRIHEPQSLAQVVTRSDAYDYGVVADVDDSLPLLPDVVRSAADGASLLVLIGPEGGLSDDELTAARDAGVVGARLGEHVLRIETAALAVAAVVGMHSAT
jgi:16S rRNA (uracil1498-N3)-methyltransferase